VYNDLPALKTTVAVHTSDVTAAATADDADAVQCCDDRPTTLELMS